ncbi:PREDICTED: odorant receptor 67c-like [Vollenhovia emeryi]|uniref:odorant receptor 67c-like n=1 Tax=Vollenhovia emeryi TaxID=411798 RepID=UPI0005F4F6F2|nr:PREDICTED: odorant receptor 67c-like [Vollenhovia emeryi]
MFVQIFVYCWGGNEVILKSTGLSEMIYHMDWMSVTTGEQKDLLMIMRRSMKPIKLTSSFLVTLSLESYVKVINITFQFFCVNSDFVFKLQNWLLMIALNYFII